MTELVDALLGRQIPSSVAPVRSLLAERTFVVKVYRGQTRDEIAKRARNDLRGH